MSKANIYVGAVDFYVTDRGGDFDGIKKELDQQLIKVKNFARPGLSDSQLLYWLQAQILRDAYKKFGDCKSFWFEVGSKSPCEFTYRVTVVNGQISFTRFK